jgi:hypothetical protein
MVMVMFGVALLGIIQDQYKDHREQQALLDLKAILVIQALLDLKAILVIQALLDLLDPKATLVIQDPKATPVIQDQLDLPEQMELEQEQ